MKCFLASLALLSALGTSTFAAEPPVYELWPGEVPGEKGDVGAETAVQGTGAKPVLRISNVTKPTLTVYKPAADKDTGAAVLICPGGGYQILAWDLEGVEVAEWLNTLGVTGIVMKYRTPRRKNLPKHQAPLQDAQRALSLIRSRAKEWKIDPDRLGILGFSAGGHLSATTSTNSDRRSYTAVDDADKLSCRPDFTILVYPAYLTGDKKGSKTLAPELRIDKNTPPMFLAHAYNDPWTAADTARLFIALKEANVPAELHIYNSGGHGFGLRPTDDTSSTWPKRCEEWLRIRGLLKK